METIPDWAELWRELVNLYDHWHADGEVPEDHWKHRARSFSEEIERRWSRPDSSRDFFVSRLNMLPEGTLVDIGAGTGAWSILASRSLASVTAVDRSAGMIEVMRENLEKAGVSNVRVVEGAWPDVDLEPHDFSLCSHAMYGEPDFPRFVRKMIAVTRRTCFILIRAPKADGLMAEFARTVLGHPNDSPNFTIAYNCLLEMGIYANVLIEEDGRWKPWSQDSLEDALADVKRRLGLRVNPQYDAYFARRLQEELAFKDGKYVWPHGVRSALIYWDVD